MFSFIKNRFYFYAIAIALTLFSLATPFLFRTNLGIDLTGGIQIEYEAVSGSVTDAKALAKSTAENLKTSTLISGKSVVNDILTYNITGTDRFVVEAGFATDASYKDQDIENAKASFTKALSESLAGAKNMKIIQTSYVNIGASFGDYIKKSGRNSIILAILFISLYIMYTFRGSIAHVASWPFAVVTGVSLIHDVIVAFGLYMVASHFFPEFKIDTFFLTAMLTILGYSINDTIVVMDRIRSNLKDGAKNVSLGKIIDKSIWDTMRRSLLTSSTVFIVVLCMFLFGPESLKGFMLALLFGTLIGTYSSVCLASPLLIDITQKK